MCCAQQELYRSAVRRGRLKALPGSRAVLGAVAQQGRRNYLVSSGSAPSIRLALEALGLAGFFSGIITSDDTPEGKPAPLPYQACLERFGLRRSEAIADRRRAERGCFGTRCRASRDRGEQFLHCETGRLLL